MENTREQPKPVAALMFSGGLDSYLTLRLWNPSVLVYCASKHRYQQREMAAIEACGLTRRVVVDTTLDLSAWERPDAIIPLRNLLFAAVGSRYADTVWLGSLKGEVNWDKTHEFYWTSSAALSHCYRASYWCEGRTVTVESPTSTVTKARLIRQALLAGMTREEIGNTVSCYSATGFCGTCSSCFKRAVATKLNGWVERYERDPFDTAVAYAAVVKAMQGGYPQERCGEILEACGRPKDVLDAIDKLKGASRG